MMRELNVDKHNVVLFDVISLIQSCEKDILRDLDRLDLLTDEGCNFRKKDTKTVFYYYILKKICDTVIQSTNKNKCVFFYNKCCLSSQSLILMKRCDTSNWKFGQFIMTLIKKMSNILPNVFYISEDDVCFDQIDICNGDGEELMSKIKNQVTIKNKKIFTFEKAKKFISDFGLTYLDEHYFNKVKIKSLVYK